MSSASAAPQPMLVSNCCCLPLALVVRGETPRLETLPLRSCTLALSGAFSCPFEMQEL